MESSVKTTLKNKKIFVCWLTLLLFLLEDCRCEVSSTPVSSGVRGLSPWYQAGTLLLWNVFYSCIKMGDCSSEMAFVSG